MGRRSGCGYKRAAGETLVLGDILCVHSVSVSIPDVILSPSVFQDVIPGGNWANRSFQPISYNCMIYNYIKVFF
jgi:hypothetical protein